MNIKELRKSKKLTQAAFAEAIGVKTPTVTAIETGRRKMKVEVISKIKEVFGVDVEPEVKKKAATKKTEKKTSKKTTKKAASATKKSQEKKGLVIQSPMGGEITPDEILAKINTATKGTGVGKIDTIYVRVDENKAYWVKGKKNGSVNLW
jgi:transcriptional regulator with XRE-family HTH domain